MPKYHGIIGDGGNKAGVNSEGELYTRARVTGSILDPVPVNFSEIAFIDGTKIKKKKSVEASAAATMFMVTVPTGKNWYLTGWNGSGRHKGYYKLEEIDESQSSSTMIDDLDAVGSWAADGTEIYSIETTTDKVEGDYALKVKIKNEKDKGIIKKTFSLDLSDADQLKVSAKVNSIATAPELKIILYSGGDSFEFSSQTLTTSYQEFVFDLGDVTGVDLSNITQIKFRVDKQTAEAGTYLDLYLDNFYYRENSTKVVIDEFFSNGFHPYTQPFYTAVKVLAGKILKISISNLENYPSDFEVGLNGREVDA